jgi:hypothetical protein
VLHSSFVHGFPCANDDIGSLRPVGNCRKYSLGCALTVINGGFSISHVPFIASFPIVRVLSSALLPGFFGPESLVLPVNLPPSAPSRLGFSSAVQFYRALSNSYRDCRRASLGKMHPLSIYRPASRQFDYSGYQVSPIHARSTFSLTPYSRFAVRYVHGFCLMLPPDIPFPVMPLPCWRCPSVR